MSRALLVLLAAGALLVGCGGPSEKEKYVKAVNAAQEEFGKTVVEDTNAITPDSDAQSDRVALHDTAQDIRSLSTKLSDIDAPGSVDDAHAQLVAEFDRYAAQVDATDPKGFAAATKLAESRIESIIEQINGGL